MIRNVRGHRIRWGALLSLGALVGVISSLVMLAIAVLLVPLFSEGTDAWTFAKVLSVPFLGSGAASPLTGFDTTPVVVGLITHFALGAVVGVLYAAVIGMFDLEGWTQTALTGILLGAFLFVWSSTLISAGLGPKPAEVLPMAAMLWGNLAFGITAGALVATWADKLDLDQDETERVRAFEGTDTTLPAQR